MSIDISTYKPADHNDTCKRCGSKSVLWWKDTAGRPHLGEIFTIEGEEVFSETDHHLRYCTKPFSRWSKRETEPDPLNRRVQRQTEINIAAGQFMEEDEDGEPVKSEIKTDGHPYCCSACGAAVIDEAGEYGLVYNYVDEKVGTTHTCAGGYHQSPLNAARMRGTRAACKVKFLAISERMENVYGQMEMHKRDNNGASEEVAELGAEYLMLRKRLYTEIPS